MKNLGTKIALAALFLLAVAGVASLAVRAQDDDLSFDVRLTPFEEVLPKATTGQGTFSARLSEDGTTLNWELSWTGLTGPPLFAHIHIGQRGVNGQVMTFLCGGPIGNPNVPAKPACPQTPSAEISGTITANDIIALNTPGANDQGVDLHDFAAFLRALRSGDGYANVHTPRFQGGEVRAQLPVRKGERQSD